MRHISSFQQSRTIKDIQVKTDEHLQASILALVHKCKTSVGFDVMDWNRVEQNWEMKRNGCIEFLKKVKSEHS